MAKWIELTWDNGKRQLVEQCYLLEEDVDGVYFKDGTPVGGIECIIPMDGEPKVLFEDENGIFGLNPHQVVHIEILKEDSDATNR